MLKTLSEQRKLQQLFTAEELGDRKPTQLLHLMQQLVGDRPSGFDSSFLHELFLQQLPQNVRMVLASTPEDTTLDKLAELADRSFHTLCCHRLCFHCCSPSVHFFGH